MARRVSSPTSRQASPAHVRGPVHAASSTNQSSPSRSSSSSVNSSDSAHYWALLDTGHDQMKEFVETAPRRFGTPLDLLCEYKRQLQDINRLEKDNSYLRAKIHNLGSDNADLTSQISHLGCANAILESRTSRLCAELETAKSTITELNSNVSETQIRCEMVNFELDNTIEEYDQEISIARDISARQAAALSELQCVNLNLCDDVISLRGENTDMSTRLITVSEKFDNLVALVGALVAACPNLIEGIQQDLAPVSALRAMTREILAGNPAMVWDVKPEPSDDSFSFVGPSAKRPRCGCDSE
jgi:hypothetical protein